MVDNRKAPEGEPSPESGNEEGEQGAHQSGGSNAEPNLVRSESTQLNSSRTDLKTCSRTCFTTYPGKIEKSVCGFNYSTTLDAPEFAPP